MLIRGVVDDEIDDNPDAALLAAVGELDEIAERAVTRIHAVIVGDVVAVVAAGRGLERHQPDRGDAEAMQIVEPAEQALEVADAVTVGVHIGADGKAVDHAILVPEIVDHPRSLGGSAEVRRLRDKCVGEGRFRVSFSVSSRTSAAKRSADPGPITTGSSFAMTRSS
ncbi:hypothetical protein ABIF95_004815 [Bradyrhizobium ottawaense]